MRFCFCAAVLVGAATLAVSPSGADDTDHHQEVLRRLDQWKERDAAPDARRALELPRPGGPGHCYALCIGLNKVDPKAYGGWDGALTGCVNDANALHRLLETEAHGVTIVDLHDERATRQAAREALGRFAAAARAGDLVVMGFAGHGGQVKDFNGDEQDGLDETLCFYDGQMIDDEVLYLFTRFAPGVKVLVLADSCHSGTAFFRRSAELKRLLGASDHPRLPREFQDRARLLGDEEGRRRGGRPALVRAMPDQLPGFREVGVPDDPVLAAEAERYGRETPSPKETSHQVRASVVMVTGCQESQLALDGPSDGLFTATLIDMHAKGRFRNQTYRGLFKEVSREMPQFQQPSYTYFGPGASRFFDERPFSAP